ncbi:MAG: DNA-binding protein [Vampirovibrionia bacterium]
MSDKNLKIHKEDIFENSLLADLKDRHYAALFLNNAIEEYLQDNDLTSFNSIIGLILKAQNVSKIATETNISRTHLYRIINNKSETTLTNAIKILNALGYQFKIEPIEESA